MTISELRDLDGLKRWELLYEDVYLVLLNDNAPLPWRSELLAFDLETCKLIWKLSPHRPDDDWIVSISIRGGNLYAWSWSCHSYRLDRRTGTVLDCQFLK